jgi:sugar phosphate isomerase/epimerase
MSIKVGFSTSVCPSWDIHEIVMQAKEMGFYGVELGTVRDEEHLPVAEDLQSDAQIDAVRKLFEDNNVEIACLASKYSLETRDKRIAARFAERTVENIVLAGKLKCPFVRVPLGAPVDRETADVTMARQSPRLAELARVANRNHVTLLVCNTARIASSRAVWVAVDGVSHSALRCAWDPALGLIESERCGLAIPRLGARISAIQVSDVAFGPRGAFLGYRPFGQGDMDYGRTVDLLKGTLFDGYLMLDWPKANVPELPEPGDSLPGALSFLLERIKHIEPVLTAYNKDKNAPNWQSVPPSFVDRKVSSAPEEGGGVAVAEEEVVTTDAPRVPKGGDPAVAARVAEAVRKARAAKAAKEGK